MIALRPAGRRKREDDRVLPLINVVFLLLIFFMLAGGFTAKDPFDLDPPVSISETFDDPDLMIVQFGKNGDIAIDGEVVAMGDLDRIVRKRLATDPTGSVQIRAHAAASAADVVELVARLGDAGIDDLKLMTAARRP
ncbi:MAG: ExbD/TolR family protein [Geminicoccaceae bacterium]